ncbi:MAG TPA: sigma-70 family RNA polymerase sigma factor [Terriglobales bacterium]|nr:sigma-70 family RNA polymerase sigma factor [Terriglobales bacterium]
MRSDIDEAIVLLKRGGDGALEKAVRLLQGAVFAFSMRVCGQRQDAEDTMQEVLVKSLPYLSKFDNSRALATWLYKVAKNRCLMNRRKSKFAPKQELSLEELMPDRAELERLDGLTAITPESSAIRGEQGQRLRDAIRYLPPPYRIILVLRDMEGFTDEEVGEITGLRPGTIRVRLHRARLFVRRELAKVNERVKQGITGRLQRNVGAPSGTGRCRKIFAGLSDYLDGELDDFSCEEIESHMNGCEPCKKFLRSLESAIQRCQQSPADCPDRERAAGLRKKLLATYSRALATSWK